MNHRHPDAVEAALNAWQQWLCSDSIDERPSLGAMIGMGSAHRIFELTHDDRYVLRVRHQRHGLNVNGSLEEIRLWQDASNAGVAPAIHYHSHDGEVVVTDRLNFNGVSIEDHATLLKQIHALPISHPQLSLVAVAEQYQRTISANGHAISAGHPENETLRQDLAVLDGDNLCFCHNDLTRENVGLHNGHVVAIDWEYASMGSPHFDVAAASLGMEQSMRDAFALEVLEKNFNRNFWTAACRSVPHINYLWAVATGDAPCASHYRQMLEEISS